MKAAVDLSEFAAIGKPVRAGCWFSRLDDDQKNKVLKAREAGYSAVTIRSVMASWDERVSKSSFLDHFRNTCKCERD